MKLKFFTESTGEVFAETLSTNPKTLKAVLQALPIESTANRWGDEVYFETPVKVKLENPVQDVEVGDVAYWPPGRAICVFFGPTPVSKSGKPRAYSPVNVFARIVGDARIFSRVKDGEKIMLFSV
jgi:hypothetical protein